MNRFVLAETGESTAFFVEAGTEAGIRRVAEKVTEDFNSVCGRTEKVNILAEGEALFGETAVLFAMCGKSPLLDKLEAAGRLDLSGIQGKWEVYGFFSLEEPFPGVKRALIIAGSDKRGTIYGMFRLSELMGVSPLCFWGDAVIRRQKEIVLSLPAVQIAREPSVQYRGFFINDEWPCFGNWTTEHFGGFTAKMYDKVFELLLRLYGNYLWPAMWTSSFALDGPGSEAAELADMYGIVIGNSHHEPCLRASEEWDKVRGEDSIYGNDWNFSKNREGLLKYWEDGLLRSAGWESMVTIGMRGERDSKVLGEEATLKDNIDLLKDIIHCQKKLILKAGEKNGKTLPMLLALYKEVEPYYYGDDNTEGLCEWEELSDVILMLCEDNFGYMRTLPDEKMRKHPGGFGMYYHLDYHGGPISYEWLNSTPLTKIWEQMCEAYDYGVRKVWIVNVGDLKFNEFPLTYFMNLAYDFEGFGTEHPGRQKEYTIALLKKHFGEGLSEEQLTEAEWILTETVRLNGLQRPEALNPSVYHPCHYKEADRMLERAEVLEQRTEAFMSGLPFSEKEAGYSLFGFAASASANLLKMHLYASKNYLYAVQGKKQANVLAEKVTDCIERDKKLKSEWASFKDGKWRGMELASHVGFTKWNEDGFRYQLRMTVTPFDRPRMAVSATEEEAGYDKVYGKPMQLVMEDFLYEPNTQTEIEIFNTGTGTLSYRILMPDCDWLSCDRTEGTVEDCVRVVFSCDRSRLSGTEESAEVLVTDGDTTVSILFKAKKWNRDLPDMTFLPGKAGYVIEACHYFEKKEPEGCEIRMLADYGVSGCGMKAYPDTADFIRGKEPSLSYRLFTEEAGSYICEIWFAPVNPLKRNGELFYGIKVNEEAAFYENTVPKGYRAGESEDRVWSMGALKHRRICKSEVFLTKGINKISLLLADAGLVAERLFLYREDRGPAVSYLGPPESLYTSRGK